MAEEVKFIFNMDDQFSAKAKQAEASVGKLENALGRVASTVTLAFAANKVYDFVKSSMDAYAKQEVYESRLTTLLHDRGKAEMAIGNIRQDAAKTPFDVASLVQGNSMLIGAGASAREARKVVMDLGNAIAATGGGSDELSRMVVNLGQIKSIGKASALDVKQFMYANIPIYQMLAENMKKTNKAFKNMSIEQIIPKIKEMDISYKDLTSALKSAREEGGMFNQGLENASMTLQGLRSNLEDTIDTMHTNIGETFADVFKGVIMEVTEEMSKMNTAYSNFKSLNKTLSKSGKNSNGEDVKLSLWERYGFGNNQNEKVKDLFQLQNKLTEIEGVASEGGKKGIESSTHYLLQAQKKLWEDYYTDKDTAMASNETLPDRMITQRKVDLISNSINNLVEIEKEMGKKKDKDLKGGKTNLSNDSSKVKQQQYTNITINIHDGLVHEFNVNTATIEGGAQNAKAIVLKGLIEAVNDSQIVARN